MNRFIAPIFATAFLPLAALAQNENVTVTGQDSLTGFWKLSPALRSGPPVLVADRYCRILQRGKDLALRCIPWGSKGSGWIEDKKIHLSWPGVMFNLRDASRMDIPGAWDVIDATWDSANTFKGAHTLKLLGVNLIKLVDAHNRLPLDAQLTLARRFLVSEAGPDTPGKADLVKSVVEEVSRGVARPHDPLWSVNMGSPEPNTARDFRDLGKIEAISYLGEGAWKKWVGKDLPAVPFTFSLYQVEFTSGQRLCGIHQREDGVLDGFLCV